MAVAQAPWTMRLVALLAMFPVATSTQRARPTRGHGDVHRYNGHRGVHHHNDSLTSDCAGAFSNYDLSCYGLAWADGNCAFVARTGGGSCSTWCAAHGTTCYAAANDVWVGGQQVCEGEDEAHGRPGVPKTQSYCGATYVGQLCVCDTGGAATAATGDPHLMNVHGQRFDLYQSGLHTLVRIPKTAAGRNTSFLMQATATRLGAGCEDIYFTKVNISGIWAREHRGADLHFVAEEPGRGRAKWNTFHRVGVKIVHGHTSKGTRYLNVLVRGLNRGEFSVGGLLGDDDHTAANTKPEGCKTTVSLTKTAPSRTAATHAYGGGDDDDNVGGSSSSSPILLPGALRGGGLP